ncbi:aminotransferase class III-fold pyridoxal phosphate-dependent enzyme [Chamaesiphon sp. VAR_69_metabat_338]|uniref:aminotransferase class III-fold pyridoxal phosphate-dependent enzyme n=1 Tax=Chamaesiphon sp. VAR_69_metabat_338 TaxID=2964704 RepID=UPI00286DBEFF|nr:aminotransferase class III-fold pyridoxal phosphate-dependent enzyme [Chamaesiphon sp. VAR_69_metabat_338]
MTIATEEIYNSFYSEDPTKTLYPGHSYTANPLGCAAALASLELLAQNEPIYTQMEQWHHQQRTELAHKYPQLTKLRVTGTIAAIDINNHDKAGYLNNVGRKIGHQAIAHGVLLHQFGNVLIYCHRTGLPQPN